MFLKLSLEVNIKINHCSLNAAFLKVFLLHFFFFSDMFGDVHIWDQRLAQLRNFI